MDALRGIAALGVVFFHMVAGHHVPLLIAAAPRWITTLLYHANWGVAIFFVLSGFVIAHSLYERRVTPGLVGRFMLRRSLRLDPPYWAAIILSLAFAALSARFVVGKADTHASVSQILAHVFYLQDLVGEPQINVAFWTLCLEVQFYLIYVLLLSLGRPRTVLIGACLLSIFWPLGIVSDPIRAGLFVTLWYGFLLGAAAYWGWRDASMRAPFMVFAAIIAAGCLARSDGFGVTCAATALLLWSTAERGVLSEWLRWRWLQFLGLISYSLYLIHNPVTGAVFRVGEMLTGRGVASESLWALGSVIACVAAAALMWWLIERPSLMLARQVRLGARGGVALPKLNAATEPSDGSAA